MAVPVAHVCDYMNADVQGRYKEIWILWKKKKTLPATNFTLTPSSSSSYLVYLQIRSSPSCIRVSFYIFSSVCMFVVMQLGHWSSAASTLEQTKRPTSSCIIHHTHTHTKKDTHKCTFSNKHAAATTQRFISQVRMI